MGDRFAIEDIQFVLGEHALVIRDEFPEFAKVIEKTGIEVVHETKSTAIELVLSVMVALKRTWFLP